MERSADWMDQASRDLAHAKQDLSTGFYEWACFSAQQAAEKAAKAVLQKTGAEAWGHSVADLLAAIASSRQIPTDLLDLAHELDKAYIPARYPNAHPAGSPGSAYTRVEAERLTAHADRIVSVCQDLLAAL
ncbi:MAG: HEPN domain-containing protein [Chloroflexi bacterium]|nr:HEPN domain-containing protein [Candidatus Rokubacteria bacterium]MBI2323576.1 HEPN domain-containing protein [Chloroflexota bacterium]